MKDWRLRFLYVGSVDVGKDIASYEAAGATPIWDKEAFGTRVAAVRLQGDPLILLAGHRPPGSVLPVFQVDSLRASVKALRQAGWTIEGKAFGIPNGPCRLVKDPSGVEWALFEETRPDPFAAGRPT